MPEAIEIKISELREIFGSLTKALEVAYLIEDIKPVIRHGFYEEELQKIEEFCRANNLFCEKSRFKVILADYNGNEEYSNEGVKAPMSDKRRGMIFVYISKDELKANLANYHEAINDHRILGRLLGYPECCIDFFIKNYSAGNLNPVLKPANPYTNTTKRNKDTALISHFPCSSDCGESIAIGKKNFGIIGKYGEEIAREIFVNLSSIYRK